MDTQASQLTLLMDLDARHEDLLVKLDELDKRVERALADCQVYRKGGTESAGKASLVSG